MNGRWKEAQEAQKKFWESEERRAHVKEEFWARKIDHGLNLKYEFFDNKDVLEVGCGPGTGIIFFLKNAKSKIGIEPMDLNGHIDSWKKQFVRKGVGEQLPFENNSFDITVCFSVLDQTIDPVKLTQEVFRVLRNKGDFLLWFRCIQSQYHILRDLLNKIDTLRPHHFTLDEILTRILKNNNNSFEVVKKNAFRGIDAKLPLKQYFPIKSDYIRNLVGACITEDVWLWLRKTSECC